MVEAQANALFGAALGLREPWMVERIEFSGDQEQLEIWLDFAPGSRFACPECGREGCPVHDTEARSWRHLDFFQHRTLLHARQPRVECPEHGVKTAGLPWARPGSGFTLLMEAFLVLVVQGGMTAAQAGRLVGEHDTRIWRVLEHYVKEARQRADFSAVRALGVDETSRRRGHRYVTVFADLKEPRVLFATEGKDAATIGAFRQDLEAHGGHAAQIEEVCLDMSAGFKKGLQAEFPGAALTFDNFHLMQLLNKAVDDVRREEQRTHPELKRTRWVWLKNDWNRTAQQAEVFEQLRHRGLATAKATQIKTVFQDIFACTDPALAESLLKSWYFWATHSRLEPVIKAAKTIKENWAGVLRWFTSRITNGLLEGINSLIQAAKARARGYRTTRYLVIMIYLLQGKLDLKLPPLRLATHTK
jgi:transposase